MAVRQERIMALIEAAQEALALLSTLRQGAQTLLQSVDKGTAKPGDSFLLLAGLLQSARISDGAIQTIADESAHFKANARRNMREARRHRLKKHMAENYAAELGLQGMAPKPAAPPSPRHVPTAPIATPTDSLNRALALQGELDALGTATDSAPWDESDLEGLIPPSITVKEPKGN